MFGLMSGYSGTVVVVRLLASIGQSVQGDVERPVEAESMDD